VSDSSSEQDARTVSALADTARLTGSVCAGCNAEVCGHEAVFSLVLGYKNAPRCLACTAAHMGESVESLRERTLTYVRHHECFLKSWQRASDLEGYGDTLTPGCLWQAANQSLRAPAAVGSDPAPMSSLHGDVAAPSDGLEIAGRWDAGDTGCGDLVLELRLRLRELPAGGIFELRATDPGAPIDLPAWCGLTGHQLLDAKHPIYWIRRKS
tara:strand:- start:308342 stop:308974 length:633 start_codon:yes stop_codon:yes gene_type:complete